MKTLRPNAIAHALSAILCCVALQQTAHAGQFSPAVNYPTGINSFGVAVGDFNRDGIPDLAVANAGGAGTVSILLGNGDGTFRASREFDAGGSETTTVAVGDFNGDGKPDLVVANYSGGGGPYRIIDAHHVKLRAGVSDRGEGERCNRRVYKIQVSCTDGRSNVARGHTIVTVSEDHRRHHDLDAESEKEEGGGSNH